MIDRRHLIAPPKNETSYVVYLQWPEGAGGGMSYVTLQDAIKAARELNDKWVNHMCEVRLLKRTKKFINFTQKQP